MPLRTILKKGSWKIKDDGYKMNGYVSFTPWNSKFIM